MNDPASPPAASDPTAPSSVATVEEIVIDDQGRPEPPIASDELATLVGFLDYQRATFEWKITGADAAALRRPHPPSTMTLAGLIKHLAFVEDHWFGTMLGDLPPDEPWAGVDWDADPDWEWHTAVADPPGQLRRLWDAAVARSRSRLAAALSEVPAAESATASADAGPAALGRPAARRWADGRAPTLRWILCHLIEEYARHNGHADLLREAADGGALGE